MRNFLDTWLTFIGVFFVILIIPCLLICNIILVVYLGYAADGFWGFALLAVVLVVSLAFWTTVFTVGSPST